MRINWRKWDHLLAGIAPGMLAPVLGIFLYYFVQSAEMHGLSVADYKRMLADKGILSMILSWTLLANLAIFALYIRLDIARAAQGVVFATLLYGMVIIYLKMF